MVLWKEKDRPLARLIKKKKRAQIKSEMKEKKSQPTPQKRIIRDYYKQLYSNKMDNLEELDKFLETYSIPKINQEEVENMNRLIMSNEIGL